MYLYDWPSIEKGYPQDEVLESRILSILNQMSLEEKIGQMIQPDLREVSLAEAKEYQLGSILNGGGAWPDGNKYSTVEDWVNLADNYFWAVDESFHGKPFRIPFMWATDAVHGHNNVFGATLFPHNIGLGSARDPDLIRRIGQVTATEVAVTGLDWTFAPTVAVPQNYRWGRVYEGYSSEPLITEAYAEQMVIGLQGDVWELADHGRVISTLKHWVGDGGTVFGTDRGENRDPELHLINNHARGYFSGLEAGAQAVMVSFNSWVNEKNTGTLDGDKYNYKIHGSRYLITDVLKNKMGFDGVVITDWNGHSEISGCTGGNCPNVVLAGSDIIMVTANADWRAFRQNLLDQVRSGLIPMERIDDAVTRILRVKMRAGLWEKPSPRMRYLSGRSDLWSNKEHRSLAREAVRKSLVLLKNEKNMLPLDRHRNYLVVGSAAQDIQKQTGGWSLTWQGNENEGLTDFPGAKTVLDAVRDRVGAENVFSSVDAAPSDAIAIVVIGEDPYAEMFGDINPTKTLEFSRLKRSYGEDLALLRNLSTRGFPIVTIFFSGRPLYVSEEINLSTAFVAGWLPGTEGGGITDLIFSEGDYEFSGRLSFAWPARKCDAVLSGFHAGDDDQGEVYGRREIDELPEALLPVGYGLSLDTNLSDTYGISIATVALDEADDGCNSQLKDLSVATESIRLFGVGADDDYTMFISGSSNDWTGVRASGGTKTRIVEVVTTPIDFAHQQDGLRIVFSGEGPGQVYLAASDGSTVDFQRYANANSELVINFAILSKIPEKLLLAMHCGWPCRGEVDLLEFVPEHEQLLSDRWTSARVPLAFFENDGMIFQSVTSPFLIFSDSDLEISVGSIDLIPGG